MADGFGTPEFDVRWRQGGFFDALNKSRNWEGKATPAEMTGMNCQNIAGHLAEMKKAMARVQAAIERIELDIRPGLSNGRVEPLHLDRNLEALGGWLATLLQHYDDFY